jgi:hypothetical protein
MNILKIKVNESKLSASTRSQFFKRYVKSLMHQFEVGNSVN